MHFFLCHHCWKAANYLINNLLLSVFCGLSLTQPCSICLDQNFSFNWEYRDWKTWSAFHVYLPYSCWLFCKFRENYMIMKIAQRKFIINFRNFEVLLKNLKAIKINSFSKTGLVTWWSSLLDLPCIEWPLKAFRMLRYLNYVLFYHLLHWIILFKNYIYISSWRILTMHSFNISK